MEIKSARCEVRYRKMHYERNIKKDNCNFKKDTQIEREMDRK